MSNSTASRDGTVSNYLEIITLVGVVANGMIALLQIYLSRNRSCSWKHSKCFCFECDEFYAAGQSGEGSR